MLARFQVRAREVAASAALIEDLAAGSRAGSILDDAHRLTRPASPRAGLGVVEAWRGTLVHRVELTDSGRLSRVGAVDPSFFNWPALPSP